jgi:alkanesulfonate monooxygenase SsuD/methylene tetrahydromethanopterin reductase-like flavin-dependent oxidoreductase (luciferase family)
MAAPGLGLYLDLRNPGGGRPWADVYRSSVERVVAAERRGLSSVWCSEHHGARDGYLPQPLTACAALAAVTQRLRIGTAVLLAPLRHARHIAEQAAVVDILSAGRLELGLGAGWSAPEFEAFGVERSRRYPLLEEITTRVQELWRSGTVTPPPVQTPLPLWIGARGPRGARLAGRLGAGLLWLDRDLMEPYRAGLAEGGHPAECARVTGLVNVFVVDDPEAVRAELTSAGRAARASSYRDPGARPAGRPQALLDLEIVDPGDAARRIAERIAGLPVRHVFSFDRIGGCREDLCDRHAELLTDAVPALLARELRQEVTPTADVGPPQVSPPAGATGGGGEHARRPAGA